ncbi:MAG: hypothetical protein ACOZNI_35275 [Myxococcota bacterium]
MIVQLLTQALYYAPSVLAHLVAFAVAGVLLGRNRRAAALLAGGTALQLLASALSYATSAGSMWAYTSGELPVSTVSAITGVVGLVASLVRAAGELGVVAAVWIAVAGGPRPEASEDPYGFPR